MADTDYLDLYRKSMEDIFELAPSHLSTRAFVLEKGLYVLREHEATRVRDDERRS